MLPAAKAASATTSPRSGSARSAFLGSSQMLTTPAARRLTARKTPNKSPQKVSQIFVSWHANWSCVLVCSCEVHQSAISTEFSASKVICGCSDEYCEQAMDSIRLLGVCSLCLNGPLLSQTTPQNRHIFVTTEATMHPCTVWPSRTKSQISRRPARAVTRVLSTSLETAVCLAEVVYPWSAPGSWYRESQLIASAVLPSCLRMLLQAETKWSACSGESGHTFLSQQTICSAIVVQKCWLVLQVSR